MTDAALPSGIELDELDPATRPQDDLFRHVNGRWLDRTEIPSDKARYGTFYQLAEQAEEAVRDIIQEAAQAEPGTEHRKFGDLFTSFLDTDRIEALGVEPIRPLLAEVADIADIAAFLPALGRFERGGVSGVLGAYVDNDPGDPSRYVVNLVQSGLGLPDESYYREAKFADLRTKYLSFLERILGLAGLDQPAERAQRILALETDLAAAHWDKVASRDAEKTYNLRTWAELEHAAAGADLAGWLHGLDAPDAAFAEVVLHQPSYLEALPALLTADLLDAWKDWLSWQIVRAFAPYLSSELVQANFDFYGTALTGAPEIRARWKRGVSFVEGSMGEAVGKVYVERHFPPTAKQGMDALVAKLVEAYRDSIQNLEWMTPATRERALEKLEKFTPKIGFPDRWRDYSSLEVSADDLIGNVRAANEFEFQRELGKIGKSLDRDEWFMTPQTINAYYNPGFNEIVFPAAILQYPFFDETRDAAANYGAIGAVIGHEIGHGFDDQGSRFDGDGRLTDWWTAEDRAAFEQRTGSLIAQYDALVPPQLAGDAGGSEASGGDAGGSADADAAETNHVNGALTIGENIGDLGGLGIAWKAYLLSLDGEQPPVIDGLTGAQRFFLSWSQAWRTKLRDAEALRLLSIDPHSPAEFRCNQIVRNIDVFYSAFDVTSDDDLWLDPEDRVTIW
ncbi:M13 family metallopeptidase [Schumannella soli]|uniref:Peptidase M13 n=1 Tax=Schumannella soli TaxID=2590779 RepID=A0A506Y7A1_9MICO|nr:M13-type metalloendopeptidase [Schumannella soli]TPW77952.1 peptidase M13 [Schumannella soli]